MYVVESADQILILVTVISYLHARDGDDEASAGTV